MGSHSLPVNAKSMVWLDECNVQAREAPSDLSLLQFVKLLAVKVLLQSCAITPSKPTTSAKNSIHNWNAEAITILGD